jgi:uncharacterized glyoxalase superfamily protein PhnB
MTETTGTTNPTTTATAVWPLVRYRDARAALGFLAEAFGFEVTAVHPPDPADGPVVHAVARWPLGGGVMISSDGSGDPLFAAHPPVGSQSVYVVTDDPDGLHARAAAAGAEIARELRDEDYGSRDFTARDPEGNLWSFGTYAGE